MEPAAEAAAWIEGSWLVYDSLAVMGIGIMIRQFLRGLFVGQVNEPALNRIDLWGGQMAFFFYDFLKNFRFSGAEDRHHYRPGIIDHRER